jgi:2-polyprenyl-3-methyl-5-hydroxy-6-metoxy-1,4-benzoquinol methylase
MSASAADQASHEALGIWEANAMHWDKAVGHEGNHYWKKLQRPCLERLLARQLEPTDEPRRALELACGNGLCSRWLAGHEGAIGEVFATDGSVSMLDRAKVYGSSGGRIVFRRLDVTCLEDFTVLLQEAGTEVSHPR